MAGTGTDPRPRWGSDCPPQPLIRSASVGAQVRGGKSNVRKADLHIHTRASDDAILEPELIFRLAKERGLAAVAYTDHEGMASVAEGQRLSTVYGVAFLPGIEITSLWRGQFAHVLDYFPNGAASSFETFLVKRVWPGRRRAHLTLMEPLRQRGVEVTIAEYDAEAQAGGYHLPLYRVLLRKGVVSGLEDYTVMRKVRGSICRFRRLSGLFTKPAVSLCLPIPAILAAMGSASTVSTQRQLLCWRLKRA